MTSLLSPVMTYLPTTPLNLSVLHFSSPVRDRIQTRRSFSEMAKPSSSGMYTTFSSVTFWYLSVVHSKRPSERSRQAIWSLPVLRSKRKSTLLSQNGESSSTLLRFGVRSLNLPVQRTPPVLLLKTVISLSLAA